MNPKDFKLSTLDRAIQIVRGSKLTHAYSCFAIKQAAKKACTIEGVTPWNSLQVQAEHTHVYRAFAESYFSAENPALVDVRRREGDSMPFWWGTDCFQTRYIPECVEFMSVFRAWLVEQGAQ